MIDSVSSDIRYYGADIVKTTWACSPSIVEPDWFAPLRKYTPAAAGRLERLPDAITASDDNREKPAAESSDQRILEVVAEEMRVDRSPRRTDRDSCVSSKVGGRMRPVERRQG